ncbi:hypothetical protein ANCCAN_11002 [Ancylostoma caninum]|uniref:Uncharacterized protein n=1 Tax=Ancylostoma caninum TaxID=29170 RepID=A0A368GF97_ANCCA|nr:hypothetical protein ANCCAN_11002 [Ancylostoma caninum]
MINIHFIALAITSYLPALSEGKPVVFVQPECKPNGYLDKNTIDNGILAPINDVRKKLAKGEVNNGMGGGKLPPATNMTLLVFLSLMGSALYVALLLNAGDSVH